MIASGITGETHPKPDPVFYIVSIKMIAANSKTNSQRLNSVHRFPQAPCGIRCSSIIRAKTEAQF